MANYGLRHSLRQASIFIFINLSEMHKKFISEIETSKRDVVMATILMRKGDGQTFFTVLLVFFKLFSFPFLIIEPLIPNYCY